MTEEAPKKGRGAAPAADEEILDFSDVRPFEPLDSGVMYLVRTSNLTKSTASTGSKMYTAELEIIAPEEVRVEDWQLDAEAEGGMSFTGLSERTTKAAGRKLFRNFSLEPQSRPFLYQYLKAMDPNVELNEAFRMRPGDWIGMGLAVKGKNRAFNEQVRLSPDRLYPASAFKG